MKKSSVDPVLALEAKMIVALASEMVPSRICTRERPVRPAVPTALSRISDEEMKGIMKAAVNTVYSLLWKKENDSEAYA